MERLINKYSYQPLAAKAILDMALSQEYVAAVFEEVEKFIFGKFKLFNSIRKILKMNCFEY